MTDYHKHTLNSIVQDKTGFLSYRTERKKSKTIPSNWVTFVFTTLKGDLWVGSNGNGIARKLNNETEFEPVKIFIGSEEITNLLSMSMYEDSLGQIWMGSWERGLFKYIPSESKFILVWHGLEKQNRIRTIIERQGQLFIGTDGAGLWSFSILAENNINGIPASQLRSTKLTNLKIQQFLNTKKALLIATDHGLFELQDNGTLSAVVANLDFDLSDKNIHKMLIDGRGNLWLGTLGSGIIVHSKKGDWFNQKADDSRQGLSNNRILSFYQDVSGVLWVGTEGGGLNYFDPYTINFKYLGTNEKLKNKLNDKMVYSISQSENGDWWIDEYRFLKRYCKN